MTETLHPHVATLLKAYSRELADTKPSSKLDARIEQLVAAECKSARPDTRRRWPRNRVARWASAACFALTSIAAGIAIGIRLERSAALPRVSVADAANEEAWPPPEFSMWPADTVALQVPVEYAPDGTLVAIDSRRSASGARYWVDVIVSNDGTVRIERVVPATPANELARGIDDGITLQAP